eukprot:scaffold76814_cov30-Prasinocladus_malaysianus.AAC.1
MEQSGTELSHMKALVWNEVEQSEWNWVPWKGHFSRPFICRGAAVGVSNLAINSGIDDQAGLSKATQAK